MKRFNIGRKDRSSQQSTKSPNTVVLSVEIDNAMEDLKRQGKQLDRQARLDGAKNIPAPEQRSASEVELEVRSRFEQRLRDLLRYGVQQISNAKQRLSAIRRYGDRLSEDPQAAVKQLCEESGHPLAEQIRANDAGAQLQIDGNETEKEKVRANLEQDLTERNNTEDELGYRPRRRSRLASVMYPLFLVLAGVFDVGISYQNIQEVAEMPPAMSLLAAFVLAFILAGTAHNLGHTLKARRYRGAGLWLSMLGTIAILTASGVLGLVFGSWFTAIMNLALFLLLTRIAYGYAEEQPRLIKKYFKDDEAIRKGEQLIARLEAKIQKVRTKTSAANLKLMHQLHNEFVTEYDEHVALIAELDKLQHSILLRFTALYEEQVHRYRRLNLDERASKGISPVARWLNSNEVLPLRLDQFTGNSNRRNDEDDGVPPGSVALPPLPKSPPPTGISLNGLTPFLLGGLLTLMSCGVVDLQNDHGVSTSVLVYMDGTLGQSLDAEASSALICEAIDLDTERVFTAPIHVTMQMLNDRFNNITQPLELPPYAGILKGVTKERLAEQVGFLDTIRLQTVQLTNNIVDLERSRLYLPICEGLEQLVQDTSQRKACFIFSDMLENTEEVSFYLYQDRPGQLLAKTDKLRTALVAQCNLPDLSGIELYLIYHPPKEIDELFYVSSRFWKAWFEEQGAEVHIVIGP